MKGELTSWKEARLKIDGSKTKPTILIHYWTECGHCQRKMPMWKKLSQDSSIDVFFLEQSNNDGNINNFPTYEVNKGKGTTKPSNITEEDDSEKLKNQLLRNSGGRRRTRRLSRRRRKTTKRALRNNMAFA